RRCFGLPVDHHVFGRLSCRPVNLPPHLSLIAPDEGDKIEVSVYWRRVELLLQRSLADLPRFVKTIEPDEVLSQDGIRNGEIRIEAKCFANLFNGFFELPNSCVSSAKHEVWNCLAGIGSYP